MEENKEEIEQPKAMQKKSTEINKKEQDVEKNNEKVNQNEKKPDEFKKEKQKKPKNTFIKKYILFILLLVIITLCAIYFSIKYLDNQNDNIQDDEQNKESSIVGSTETAKKVAEDSKYGINSYTETYNQNDLKFTYYADINGKVKEYDPIRSYELQEEKKIKQYVQINGLKNKEIQNKINEKIKKEIYKEKNNNTYISVEANFSNVLSIAIYSESKGKMKTIGLNIDLTTGEDIPFEKVFVSSAPINSYLAEGLYANLAWAYYEKFGNSLETLDMKDVDTSEFEDKFLQVVANYKKAKENGSIQYTLKENKVTVYGLIDEKIIDKDYPIGIEIKLLNKKEEVAIYKRYLTNESIFDNTNIGEKNLIVFTQSAGGSEAYTYTKLNYGKISDNIFMEEYIQNYEDMEIPKAIVSYIKKQSQDKKKSLLSEVPNTKGMFYQRVFTFMHVNDADFYRVAIEEIKTTCDIDYFKEEAFKDFIEYKDEININMCGNGFFYPDYGDEKQNKNLKTEETMIKDEIGETIPAVYLSKSGEYLGKTEEEAREKVSKNKDNTKDQTEVTESNPESSTNTTTNTTIINENNTITNSIQENSIETNSIYSNNEITTNDATTTNNIESNAI